MISGLGNRNHKPWSFSAGEEHGVPAGILPNIRGVVLGGIEFLPARGRVDVLVALIPSTVNDFRRMGIVAISFERRVWRYRRLGISGLLLALGGGLELAFFNVTPIGVGWCRCAGCVVSRGNQVLGSRC